MDIAIIGQAVEVPMFETMAQFDADVREFYDKNPNEFSGLRASHILIRPSGFDEDSKKKAKAQAEDILKQAKAGGDFAELARKHSADGGPGRHSLPLAFQQQEQQRDGEELRLVAEQA